MMTPLAAFWLNQPKLSLMNPRAVIAKRVVSDPSLTELAREESQVMKTGVYFNNCEVSQYMHPSQVRYLNRYTSGVPTSLPAGKPMPARPKLLTQRPCKIELPPSDQDVDLNQYLTFNDCKRKTESKECEAEPAKRRRTEKSKPNNLSSEEQVFIEAALALSESCNFSRKFSQRVSSTNTPPQERTTRTSSTSIISCFKPT
jgi:hypothetical protein